MTTRTTRSQLPRPPGICDECYCDQTHHPLDAGQGVYYCSHNDVLAICKADFSGWFSESGVNRAEWKRRAEAAATTVDLLAAAAKKMN